MSLAIDIETYGRWSDLPPYVKAKAMSRAKPDEKLAETCALHWTRSKIIAIGVHHIERAETHVLYESKERDDRAAFTACADEKALLSEFWRRFDRRHAPIITWNGRAFDLPFLSNRSAVNRVATTYDLNGHRYDYRQGCDLVEVLTHQGADRNYHSLAEVCHAFGIDSPKSGSVIGEEVHAAYELGRVREIAEYCGRDVEATAALFRILRDCGLIKGIARPRAALPLPPQEALDGTLSLEGTPYTEEL